MCVDLFFRWIFSLQTLNEALASPDKVKAREVYIEQVSRIFIIEHFIFEISFEFHVLFMLIIVYFSWNMINIIDIYYYIIAYSLS